MRSERKGSRMNTQTIIDAKNDVIQKHGEWTAHNICLQDDVYTIAPRIVGDEVKLRRIVQCVFDLAGGSVEGLRILDLACLEGLYAIEFARHKAKCVGIEGREANLAKARFTKDVLRLIELVHKSGLKAKPEVGIQFGAGGATGTGAFFGGSTGGSAGTVGGGTGAVTGIDGGVPGTPFTGDDSGCGCRVGSRPPQSRCA